MQDWFTVEVLDPETYVISEPRHWEQTHCYLLCGSESALLIDTGLGVGNIGEVVRGLTALPVLAGVTHVHWDHIGGLGCFDNIAVHELEREWLSGGFPLPLKAVRRNLTAQPREFPEGFDPEKYRIFQGEPHKIFRGGDIFDLGSRQIEVLHTPGHSPGHCCFYERERGYLFSGDLIYRGKLDCFYPTTDPALFHRSVKAMRGLDVSRILPGHFTLPVPLDIIGRIDGAFAEVNRRHGIFDFGDFAIQL